MRILNKSLTKFTSKVLQLVRINNVVYGIVIYRLLGRILVCLGSRCSIVIIRMYRTVAPVARIMAILPSVRPLGMESCSGKMQLQVVYVLLSCKAHILIQHAMCVRVGARGCV